MRGGREGEILGDFIRIILYEDYMGTVLGTLSGNYVDKVD